MILDFPDRDPQKINFCFLSLSVCSIWLQQPRRRYFWFSPIPKSFYKPLGCTPTRGHVLLGLVVAAVTIATTAGPLTTLHLLQAVLRLQRSVGSAQTPLPTPFHLPPLKHRIEQACWEKQRKGGKGKGGEGRAEVV